MKKQPIVVLDNGASTIKLGVVAGRGEPIPKLITNAVVRSKGDKTTYFGQEFERCKDFSSLHYRLPFEKGYLVDWDAQKAIWDDIFTPEYLKFNPSDASLLITEPYFNLPNLQDVYDQFVFEEYEFDSYARCTPASLIPYGSLFTRRGQPKPECILMVDSGFSFTHIVPVLNGEVVWEAVRRIDVGGKLLTNHLKELVSFRQWNMMDETYVVNKVKEECCYVSLDFKRDIEICRSNPRTNSIVQGYILPDFSLNRAGRVRQPDEHLQDSYQILYMNNERFSVPELLFRPDDIGLEQSGLPAAISHSIGALPEELRGMFWANIGLIGGCTRFPGFAERLTAELRALAPTDCEVEIYESSDPISEAYRSAVSFARSPVFAQRIITREEYLEMGSNASLRKFRDWKPSEKEGKGKEVRRDEDEETAPPAKRGRGRGRGVASALGRRKTQ